jgi:hypothetical protein
MCCSADQRHDLDLDCPRQHERRLRGYLQLIWLLLAALLLPAPAARAQPGTTPTLEVTPSADALSVTLSCPTPVPALLVAIDGLPVVPLALTPSTSLPAELHGVALLAPGAALRLSLPTAGLAPGLHRLSVSGCGATPLEAAFTMPAHRPLLWPLAIATALAVSAGAGWIAARLRPVPSAAPAPAAQPAGPAEITTARRPLASPAPDPLRAIIWDGRSRRIVALHGRQWSLGADPGCDLCVADAGLAPLHARLSLIGEQIEVTALEAAVFHTGLGCALTTDQATPLGEGEALLLGAAVRLTIEAS